MHISGKRYNIAVSSGSTSLIGALYANNISGLKVAACIHMIPSSYLSIFVNNNQIIPISFDETSLCPSLVDIKEKYKKYQFDALIYCDYYGSYQNIVDIHDFCSDNSVVLIRDSSHSHHFIKKNDPSNEVEHVCYSFQTAKPLSGFEGGMFSTDDPRVASQFCYYGTQSKYLQEIRQRCIPVAIEMSAGCGHKFRINPLASASLLPDLILLPIQNFLIRAVYILLSTHPNKILSHSLYSAYKVGRSAAFCSNIVLLASEDFKLRQALVKSRLPFYQRDYDLKFIEGNPEADVKQTLAQARLHFSKTYFIDIYSLLGLASLPRSISSFIFLI